ncbi:hypothetical protein Pmani_026798 [Petrolisthes manimaculis]|uniref:Uncharacterized protein n=1 Tax=Petrolisthes manimaculis TaxID=1843537 RepID=A0AAE1TZS2_9EUCA|nr:hypothetical protein Pmani_026796 [Petrolisthes manimaculis]KAK4301040.1 hypothetical protein Pmani_026797 [Petrolisthes manimaculis]KAK4301041.1 hypothetical protein Pmani_026798 [Petrolisthes manimaculis]
MEQNNGSRRQRSLPPLLSEKELLRYTPVRRWPPRTPHHRNPRLHKPDPSRRPRLAHCVHPKLPPPHYEVDITLLAIDEDDSSGADESTIIAEVTVIEREVCVSSGEEGVHDVTRPNL